ncbi:hypothetical protein MP228_009720 [Amoeboaphelidium protococcarum]|nr:hypothetical protein MP228_009720 [Amoeboaphelidium protococcarum]
MLAQCVSIKIHQCPLQFQRVASVVVNWSSPSPDTTLQSSAHVATMGVKLEKVGFSTVALRRVEGASPSSPTLCSVALMLLAPFCMYRPTVLTVNRSRWSQAQRLPKLLSLRPTLLRGSGCQRNFKHAADGSIFCGEQRMPSLIGIVAFDTTLELLCCDSLKM